MDRPPGTVRSRVAGGVAKLRARRAAGRQSGINNTEVPDLEIDVCSDDLNELHDMWSDSDGSDVLGADECGSDAPSPLELSGFAA